MNLFDDLKYSQFLSQTHPELNISLDRFMVPTYIAPLEISEAVLSPFFKKILSFVGAISPRLSKPKTLLLGVPFEPYEQTRLFDAISNPLLALQILTDIANKQELDLIVCSNMSATHPRFAEWIKLGFTALPSFPDTVVNIASPNFESHLAQLQPSSRASIRRNIRSFKRAGLRLVRLHETKEIASLLYEAYRQFYDRASVRWYAHSLSYFAQITRLDERIYLTAAMSDAGEIVGFIVNFSDGAHWHSGRIGVVPRHFQQNAIYFRLMYHAIEEAIANQAASLSLEPTSYSLKQRLGAQIKPLENLVFGVSRQWKTLLKICTPLARCELAYLNNLTKSGI